LGKYARAFSQYTVRLNDAISFNRMLVVGTVVVVVVVVLEHKAVEVLGKFSYSDEDTLVVAVGLGEQEALVALLDLEVLAYQEDQVLLEVQVVHLVLAHLDPRVVPLLLGCLVALASVAAEVVEVGKVVVVVGVVEDKLLVVHME